MTTEYLLDTNACIAIRDLLANKTARSLERQQRIERLRARWLQVPRDCLAMSVVTLGELRFGVSNSNDPATSLARLNALREIVRVLGFDTPGIEALAEHYGEIRAALEAEGKGIGPNDTWIAAHGRALGFTVVTNNRDEFGRVPGLVHEDWMA
jgi:tRNA(fMet)-specific endonuclease VapC